ncbi:MAG: outer membrane beta-barrel protein [Bacteroidales bacterium]|nr:outer membrane beta-barrel protein [Bacteroidales bacterium]
MKNLLLSLLLSIFAQGLLAQEFTVSGILLNQEDQKPLVGATIKLVSMKDTTQFRYSSSLREGDFSFEKVQKGPYRLEITYIGFEKYTQVFGTGKGSNLGKISLKPASTSLGGIDIQGTAVRAEQKGDTTQYNADAFKVTQDASTEDLIKKMPGITVENGTVKAHGEEVKKVLVDGKQFFGEDPSVTLKNLPAEVVDKIQVFDKLSDQAAWTGFDDGSGQKTLNIVTRNARNSGQFGKFSAGYGSDDRYLLGANVNFFEGQRRITLLGMSNNVNQQNFSADDVIGSSGNSRQPGMGGGRMGGGNFQMGPQSGIFSTNAIGVNYTDAWGKKISFNVSYFLNNGITSTDKLINRQYILGGENTRYYKESSNSRTDNTNHRLNLRVEYNPDSNNSIIVTPRLSIQDNQSNSFSGASTAGEPLYLPENLLNTSSNNNESLADGYNFNNELLYRHKFLKKGRTVSINLGTGVSNRYRENYVDTRSIYYQQQAGSSNDTVNQFGKSLTNGLNLSSNLVYTEPVGKNSQVQLNYNIAWSQNDNDKKTYNYASDQLEYSLFDTLLSSIYDNEYLTHRLGTGYLYQTEKMNLNAGLTYQYADLKGNTSFPLADSTQVGFNSILPNLMVNYKFSKVTNLRLIYRASTNAPSTSQLQRVLDNSNPVLLSTGNPGLNQEVRHFATTRFSHSNQDKTRNLFAMLFFQMTRDYIGNSTLVAFNDTMVNGQEVKKGSQLTIPQNLDGAWNTRALFTFGFPVKPIRSNLNFNTGVSYNRLPSLINALANTSNTYGLNLGAVLSSNINEKVDFTFTYNLNYNLVENTLQPDLDNNYFFQIGSVQFNWEFWKGFFFQNSLTYQQYSGLSSDFQDRYTLWNFNLGKKLFKKKSGEIKLSCYDILDQNKSLTRTVTDTYIEDANTVVLRQYFMLSFTYNLRNFTGKAPESNERRFDGRFEGRPPDGSHMH